MRKKCLILLLTTCIISLSYAQTVIYQERFNAPPMGWVSIPTPGTNQVWEWTPDGTGRPGPHWGNRRPINSNSGSGAYIFNSDLFYSSASPGAHDASAVMPALDCTGQPAVFLSFQQYYRNLSSTTTVEVSTDGGVSWTAFPLNGGVLPQQETFNGERVFLDLSAIAAGEPNVRIRFRFQGRLFFWIIDDIFVTNDLPAVDIGILGLAQPLDPCLLTDEEAPKLVLSNNGKAPIGQFQYAYILNGTPSPAVNSVFTPALLPGETRVFDPQQTIDLSANTGYVLQFLVNTNGDALLQNNTYSDTLEICPIAVDSMGGQYIANQLIVRFIPGLTDLEKEDLRDKYNAVVVDSCLCDPGLELWEIGLPVGPIIDIEGVKDQASSESKIEDTGFNYPVKLDKPVNYPILSEPLPITVPTGPVVKVAIIDSGEDFPHLNLKDHFWVNEDEFDDPFMPDDDVNCFDYDHDGFNFVTNGGLPQDDNGHGSHIAGIIVLGLNDCVSPQIMSLKTMNQSGAGYLFHSLCAIYYASDKGAQVINYSAGYVGEESSMFRAAVRYAKKKNVVLVASAGNEGANNDIHPHYPSQFSVSEGNVISVAAYDQTSSTLDTLTSFSNYGQVVDLAASGFQIISTVPGDTDNMGFALKDGTSMAAAKVSRQLVLFLANNQGATYTQAKDYIQNLATIPLMGSKDIGGGAISQLTNCAPVSVHDLSAKTEVPVTAFPQPFTDEFQLEFRWPEARPIRFSVYNSLGQRMMEQSVQPAVANYRVQVDGRLWPSGVYFVFMESAHFRARATVTRQ